MAVFIGTYAMKIDAKGRVSMPAAFRDALIKTGSTDAVLMPTEGSPVIEGCDRAYVEELVNRAYTPTPNLAPEARDKILLLLGEMVTLSLDPDGRFVFPAPLRAHAGCEENALFVGRGRTFQILQPAMRAEAINEAKAGGEKISLTDLMFYGEGRK